MCSTRRIKKSKALMIFVSLFWEIYDEFIQPTG